MLKKGKERLLPCNWFFFIKNASIVFTIITIIYMCSTKVEGIYQNKTTSNCSSGYKVHGKRNGEYLKNYILQYI